MNGEVFIELVRDLWNCRR